MSDGIISIVIAIISSGIITTIFNQYWNKRQNLAKTKALEAETELGRHETFKKMLADRDEVIEVMSTRLKESQTRLLKIEKNLIELESVIYKQDLTIMELRETIKHLETPGNV